MLSGNLTVSGTTTTVSSTTINVADPLLALATTNSSADTVDIGFYGLYDVAGTDKYTGFFRDAGDSGKWKIFKDLQTVPTTVVNTEGTGYTTGTLVANVEGNVTGNLTGTASAIADNTVNASKIVAGSITTAEIAANTILTANIADNNINATKIISGAVLTRHIGSQQVTTNRIDALAITNGKLAADAVDGTKIADDSIDSEHYVPGSNVEIAETFHCANIFRSKIQSIKKERFGLAKFKTIQVGVASIEH